LPYTLLMKRIAINLEEIAEWKNLLVAFHKAARGKRQRPDVRLFLTDFEANMNRLGDDIRGGHLPYGKFRTFTIFDPKRRLIHAACFADRLFHHALINCAGAVLERAMTPVSFACRPEMGVHKAVQRVQQHLRQYDWYGKIDIDGYFASISHERMLAILMRRFKGRECEEQLRRVLDCYHAGPGRGLPIGSLTSQHFANYYLDGLDRLLADLPAVRARVRYMDDILWWCDDRQGVRDTLSTVTIWLRQERELKVKTGVQIQSSRQGVTYCGFCIRRGAVRLGRRRKRRYLERRRYWESHYLAGRIDARQLQTAHAAVHAITSGTDSLGWRRENLRRHPSPVV
jgi:RNA-directed DNA polymerase